jgi:hypothetical protein
MSPHGHVPRTLIAAAVLLAPTLTGAMTVEKATVRVNPTRTDTVRLAGSLPGMSLDGAESIRVALDGVGFEVPVSAFTRKRRKLRYRATGDEPGISSMRIDTQSGKFEVALRPLALGTIESPVTLDITAGETSACTRLRLVDRKGGGRRRGRPRPQRFVLSSKKGLGDSCAVETPDFDPPALLVGDPRAVIVLVGVAGTVGDGGARLHAADATGVPTGSALCTLLDDGDASHGDATAGDGRFSCILDVDTAAPRRLRVVATATIDGTTEVSPVGDLGVSALISQEELQDVLAMGRQAADVCRTKMAEHGDTLRARLAAVAALRTDPRIARIGIAEESGAITLTHDSGIVGGACGTCVEVPGLEPAARASLQPLIARSTEDDDAQLITSHRVFVWSPQWRELISSEAVPVAEMYERSTCPRFQVTRVLGQAATADALAGISGAGTIVLVSHGTAYKISSNLPFNCIYTKDRIGDPEAGVYYRTELHRRGLALDWDLDATSCVTPWRLRRLSLRVENAFFWGGFCLSGLHRTNGDPGSRPGKRDIVSLVDTFLAGGVHTYFGFTRKVSDEWSGILARRDVFPQLLQSKTTAEVFDAVDPKVDPHNDRPDIALARFVSFPQDGRPLVYLKAKITPKNPGLLPGQQQALTVTVEGADDCSLQYHWRNSGLAGHLLGGDDVTTTSPTVTYEAGAADGALQDIVRVEVLDVADAPKTLLTRDVTIVVSPGCVRCSEVTNADTCTPLEKCCADGQDNDLDGPVDCDDVDCRDDPACQSTTTTTSTPPTTAIPTNCPSGYTPLTIRGESCCQYLYSCGPFVCDAALSQSGPGGCDLWCRRPDEGGHCAHDIDGLPVPEEPEQKCCCGVRSGECVWP